jgi:hypothetical protein
LQCKSQECSQSLCLACFQNGIYLDKFLEEHFEKNPMHKEFLAIYPEEWYVTSAWKKDQNPCKCLTYAPLPHFLSQGAFHAPSCYRVFRHLPLSDWPLAQIRILHVLNFYPLRRSTTLCCNSLI